MTDTIPLELAYAHDATQQVLLCFPVPAGSTVAEAIRASGILVRFPELAALEAACQLEVGIGHRCVGLDSIVQAHDRIEIYRPLRLDPKAARRLRAARPMRGTKALRC